MQTKVKLSILFALLLPVLSCTKKSKEPQILNLAIWSNYIDTKSLEEFKGETGIQVNITNYESNEELLEKLKAGADFDVAVPSDYMVAIMAGENLLQPIDQEQLKYAQLIFKDLLNQPYDPGNKYSFPYSWTTAGIAYNKKAFPDGIKDWKTLFEDNSLEGKISLMNDLREVIGAALKKNGFSVNTTKPEELAKAKEDLLALKPRVKRFNSDTIESLVSKEVTVAHAYSSYALLAAAASNGEIGYAIPAEGGTRSIDNLVIFSKSKKQDAALQLINFLLSPEVNAQFVKKVYGGPVLRTTIDSLPLAFKDNKTLFPEAESLAKLERIVDLGDNLKLYEKVWSDLKIE